MLGDLIVNAYPNECGYIKNCKTVLSFLGVFDMRVEWNGRSVL